MNWGACGMDENYLYAFWTRLSVHPVAACFVH